jgi:membrane protein required for colicin V production
MQPYDIFMLIVLVGAAAFGAWKGMAWQLASIGSVLLSTIVALRFSGLLAPSLSAEEPWNQFLAMGILFAATSLGVWIAFRFVAKMIDRVKLKEFDRQMGALFGAAKGVLYCLIITFFAVTLSEGTRQRVLDSRSGYYAAVLVQKGTPLMPEKVRTALGKYIQKLDDGLNPDTPLTTPKEQLEELGTAVADAIGDEDKVPFNFSSDQPALPAQFALPEQGAQLQQQVTGQLDGLGRQMGAAFQQQVDQFGREVGQQMGAAVEQQVDQFGRKIDSAIDQNYNQIRTSASQTGEQIRTDFRQSFDAIGRRIQQAPMQPIR